MTISSPGSHQLCPSWEPLPHSLITSYHNSPLPITPSLPSTSTTTSYSLYCPPPLIAVLFLLRNTNSFFHYNHSTLLRLGLFPIVFPAFIFLYPSINTYSSFAISSLPTTISLTIPSILIHHILSQHNIPSAVTRISSYPIYYPHT